MLTLETDCKTRQGMIFQLCCCDSHHKYPSAKGTRLQNDIQMSAGRPIFTRNAQWYILQKSMKYIRPEGWHCRLSPSRFAGLRLPVAVRTRRCATSTLPWSTLTPSIRTVEMDPSVVKGRGKDRPESGLQPSEPIKQQLDRLHHRQQGSAL